MNPIGFQMGGGVEEIYIGSSDFLLSFRAGLNIYKKMEPFIHDSILFDLPSHFPNEGYASIQNTKVGYYFQADIGYNPNGGNFIYPYLSLGIDRLTYATNLRYGIYGLYEIPPDLDVNYRYTEIHDFQTIGFQSGIGFKLVPLTSNYSYFDFRFTYSGAWLRNSYIDGLPNLNSFHVDENGQEHMEYYQNRYMSNFGVQIGIVFVFNNS